MSSEVTEERKIAAVLMRLFRPAIKLALRHALKLNDLIEMLKIVLVEVAAEELKAKRAEGSVSKLSVMTGVHRKDVTRISKSTGEFSPPSDLISKIMVQWQHDKRFCSSQGRARALSAEGRESEFAKLVESVNGGNLSAYAVLYEMERSGIVRREGKKVRLCWRDFVVSEDVTQGLALLAQDSEDLSKAVERNLYERPDTLNLHLKTEFNNIRQDRLDQVKAWLLEQGSLFHKKVREYLTQHDCDLTPPKQGEKVRAGGRVALGAFSVVEKG